MRRYFYALVTVILIGSTVRGFLADSFIAVVAAAGAALMLVWTIEEVASSDHEET